MEGGGGGWLSRPRGSSSPSRSTTASNHYHQQQQEIWEKGEGPPVGEGRGWCEGEFWGTCPQAPNMSVTFSPWPALLVFERIMSLTRHLSSIQTRRGGQATGVGA